MAKRPFAQTNKRTPFGWFWNKWVNRLTAGYHQPGGRGERLGKITPTMGGLVTNLQNAIDGLMYTAATLSAGTITNSSFMNFDFGPLGDDKIVTGMKVTMQANGTQGVWQPRTSQDGSSWSNLGGTITLGSAGNNVTEYTFTNTNARRFFSLLGSSGTTTPANGILEIEFKIDQ